MFDVRNNLDISQFNTILSRVRLTPYNGNLFVRMHSCIFKDPVESIDFLVEWTTWAIVKNISCCPNSLDARPIKNPSFNRK